LALLLATILMIFALPVFIRKIGVPEAYRAFISAILLSIIVMTAIVTALALPVEKVALGNTVGSLGEFGQLIANYFPGPQILTTQYLLKAAPLALQLAILGYLDSLLTALVIDRMTKEQTAQNKELIAQGLSNAAAGLLQGIPGAQATIRSVLLVKEGAQTRLAGVMMGVFALIFLLFLKDWITLIPVAVFAGVLFKAGWDVCDRDFTAAYFQFGWMKVVKRNFQMFVILLTTVITALVDLNVAVITGTIVFYAAQRIFAKYELTDVEAEFESEVD
jgi:SulP family sulfate permease